MIACITCIILRMIRTKQKALIRMLVLFKCVTWVDGKHIHNRLPSRKRGPDLHIHRERKSPIYPSPSEMNRPHCHNPKQPPQYRVGQANITVWNDRTQRYLLNAISNKQIDLWCIQEHHLGEQATKFLSGKLRKKNYKVHAIPARQVLIS